MGPTLPAQVEMESPLAGPSSRPFSNFQTSSSQGPQHLQQQQHRVVFQPSAVSGAPSALGFGFGIGSSLGGNNELRTVFQATPSGAKNTVGFGSGLGGAVGSPPYSFANRQTATKSQGPFWASRSSQVQAAAADSHPKRRKSISSDESDDDGDASISSPGKRRLGVAAGNGSQLHRLLSNSQQSDARQLVPKKMRTGFAASPSLLDDLRQSLPTQAPIPSQPEQDDDFLLACTLKSSAVASSELQPSRRCAAAKRPASAVAKDALARTAAKCELDVGEMLSWMDRPSLLSLLQRLLDESHDRDAVREQIIHLLPNPTLEIANAALDEAEKGVHTAMPGNVPNLRPEYVWSRIRSPIAEFAKTALRYLPFFGVESKPVHGYDHSSSPSPLPAPTHPATSFAFLHTVTSRALSLEAMLPPVPSSFLTFPESSSLDTSCGATTYTDINIFSSASGEKSFASYIPTPLRSPASPDAIFTLLMPALLNAWQAFGVYISHAANEQGRIFSQEHLTSWFEALSSLSIATPQGGDGTQGEGKVEVRFIRQAAGHLGQRLYADCGWMLGKHRAAAEHSGQHHQQPSTRKRRGSFMDEGEHEEL
ncbi:hypothetical protein K437DRAFT_270364 [Tilletiaria anomala UBC 951]|uniref:Tethering factor for nuclear proteasome STS1 n=1 Tax=Tilletiaria anomala (strain ATCC 24038 / CBS 436.72 / UBC 951) TaxID=1037660 RepID=A0A066VBM0_TILAU|nr:uncharacterized protein K437DRAFT_270364 [Tilletiaria anomala UBC 951]KDN39152.1 hypothetical protein K437DRAFT_270364 [Tilletiaria anomala UBC 951]